MSKDNSILGRYKREASNPANRERIYPIYLQNRDRYPLPFSEYEIHHKDFNKNNNDLKNLVLLTPTEHDTIHLKKIQKIQSQKNEIDMIEKVREESEREEKRRIKEMKEIERERKIAENEKKEVKRRRVREYEDEKRLMVEREKNRAHHKNEDEKRTIERQKELEGIQISKRNRKIKKLIEGVTILFFIVLLTIVIIYINRYAEKNRIEPIEKEREPIELSYQEIINLCEQGCKSEGGFGNSYSDKPEELHCTCKNAYANGQGVIKIFSKTKQRWTN